MNRSFLRRSFGILLLLAVPYVSRAQATSNGGKAAPAPTRTASVAAIIRQVNALCGKGQFATAESVLKAHIAEKTTSLQNKAMRIALADVYFWWAGSLAQNYDFRGAIAHYQAAYTIDKMLRRPNAATDLHSIGVDYWSLSQYEKALICYQQALSIYREIKDQAGEATTLNNMGVVYWSLSRYQKALAYYMQALSIRHAIHDRTGEANTLCNIGESYRSLSRYELALNYFRRALPIQHAIRDRDGEANTLNNIGVVYWNLSRYKQALAYYMQALPIRHAIHDRTGEANTLCNIGESYRSLSRYEQALTYYMQALPIQHAIHDKVGEATTLNNTGVAYWNLSQYQRALAYYMQALPIRHAIHDRSGEANTLNNIGAAYGDLSQYQQALTYYMQALPIQHAIHDKVGEATTLNNTGAVYWNLSRYEQALNYFRRSLPIRHTIHDRDGEASTLSNIGSCHLSLGRYEESLIYYQQALSLWREVENPSGEASILNNLMALAQEQHQPTLAILYGKQSVNLKQAIRRDIQGLDKESQQSYLHGNEDTYRTLARLLIGEGRFAEAEEVLRMVKEAEFFEFVRRDAKSASPLKTIAALTGNEPAVVDDIDKHLEAVVMLSQEQWTLQGVEHPTDAQKARLQVVNAQLKTREAELNTFFASLPARFARNAADVQTDRNRLSAMQPVLRQLGGKVALLSTLVDDKGYDLIFTGPSGPSVHLSFTFSPQELGVQTFKQKLNGMIYDFLDAIQQRQNVDAKARALYDVIFCKGELAKQLAGTGITTLMWRLDGTLRYLPLAALRDNDGYLVEKYQNVLLTAGSSDLNLEAQPQAKWSALALGVTGAHTVEGDEFPALTGVDTELRAVMNDPADGYAAGVLPGLVLRDAGFTQSKFFAALRGATADAPVPYTVIHIASHFRLRVDTAQSYLLMGDGTALHLSELQQCADEGHPLFTGVDLMTLSACQTAAGGTVESRAGTGASDDKSKTTLGSGVEVDSFGALAELNGAKAVLATLWPIADTATPELMSSFYLLHQSHPEWSKARALQEAQLSLLHGSIGGGSSDDERAIRLSKNTQGVAPFVPDPNKPFAHPYYWAPFILMGNWR